MMMKRGLGLLFLTLGFVFFGHSLENPKKATRTITYYEKEKITVPKKINRIASAWNAQNSIIAMLGYGDRIVATTEIIRSSPVFRKFVPSIKKAAVCVSPVGGVNAEELLKSKPDIVFLTGGSPVHNVDLLKQMNLPFVSLKANSMKNLVERAVITGRILGDDAYARALKYVDYYKSNVERVRTRIAGIPQKRRVRVYHSMGNPLATAAAPSLVQDWMDLAGVVNVAKDWDIPGAPGMAAKNIDLEQIIAANPEAIICMNAADAVAIGKNPAWKGIQAVKNGKIFVNPQGMFYWCRETTEEALQFLWAAKTIYPDYFRDIDMANETRSFYKNFYKYDLSDEVVRLFLNPK